LDKKLCRERRKEMIENYMSIYFFFYTGNNKDKIWHYEDIDTLVCDTNRVRRNFINREEKGGLKFLDMNTFI